MEKKYGLKNREKKFGLSAESKTGFSQVKK
jgi:hypothetical protein